MATDPDDEVEPTDEFWTLDGLIESGYLTPPSEIGYPTACIMEREGVGAVVWISGKLLNSEEWATIEMTMEEWKRLDLVATPDSC